MSYAACADRYTARCDPSWTFEHTLARRQRNSWTQHLNSCKKATTSPSKCDEEDSAPALLMSISRSPPREQQVAPTKHKRTATSDDQQQNEKKWRSHAEWLQRAGIEKYMNMVTMHNVILDTFVGAVEEIKTLDFCSPIAIASVQLLGQMQQQIDARKRELVDADEHLLGILFS